MPALADHKEHAWLCASGHDYAEAATHYFRQKNALGQVVKAYRAGVWSIGQEEMTLPQPF